MADFIVDESKFLLNDEEEHSLFENGFTLSCGITVGDKEDESDCCGSSTVDLFGK